MEICIFDMDGVLIRSGGYHKALKDTVRFIGAEFGYEEAILSDEQISRFEALGISSEWHSSAFCKAMMLLQKARDEKMRVSREHLDGHLDLDDLFNAIAEQPMHIAPVNRGKVAVVNIAKQYGVAADSAMQVLENSISIDTSETINVFEELVLGSARYHQVYGKKPRFSKESYLLEYDRKLLEDSAADKVVQWANEPGHGAALMTNRPSKGPMNFRKSPDAELGLGMIGLDSLPVIGFGEVSWLAEQSGKKVEEIGKPGMAHALAAILAACGWPIMKSLEYSILESDDTRIGELQQLKGSTILVFEDTPAGIVAVQEAVDFLNQAGLDIHVKKYGIGDEEAKIEALTAQGAVIYPEINRALEDLDLS